MMRVCFDVVLVVVVNWVFFGALVFYGAVGTFSVLFGAGFPFIALYVVRARNREN